MEVKDNVFSHELLERIICLKSGVTERGVKNRMRTKALPSVYVQDTPRFQGCTRLKPESQERPLGLPRG